SDLAPAHASHIPFPGDEPRNDGLQDPIGQPPEPVLADPIVRNPLGLLPGRKTLDHLVVGIGPGEIAELHVEKLGDLALGELPALRRRDPREIRKHAITGRARLLQGQTRTTGYRVFPYLARIAPP